MGFAKAQREQTHIPGATDGAFIPAAAKSNVLISGTAGGAGEGVAAGAADGAQSAGVSHV